MASDLSKIIPENLSSTLNALLAKDTELKEYTKVDKRDFQSSEILQLDVEFVFDKLTSIISYYIPAKSASIIFNIMMASPDNEILANIDDDTADAMAEFVSNTCGGLVTTINANEFEDLGQSKFSIKHKETLDGNLIESVDNMYRFLIDVEGQEIVIFTHFEENFNGFIAELTNSKVTLYPEDIQKEEIVNTKEDEPKSEEKQENKKESKETIEEKSTENEEENTKPKKLKLIIMIVAGLIVIVLLIGIIMYFAGAFDSEPIKKQQDTNTTAIISKKQNIIEYKTLKKVDFKMSDINIKRLNNKLELLTKYQVLTQEELESQAQEEKQRIIRLKKEQELIKFAERNKEEPLVVVKSSIPPKKDTQKEHQKKTKVQKDSPSKKMPDAKKINKVTKPVKIVTTVNSKLKFVVANSLRYRLFKKLVLQTNSTQARISICNSDAERTQIFIGPFESEQLRLEMRSLIAKSDPTVTILLSNITHKEFNTKCNF